MPSTSYAGNTDSDLETLREEAARRPTRTSELDVVFNPLPISLSDYHLGLPGTATVFVYNDGSPYREAVLNAVHEGGQPTRALAEITLAYISTSGFNTDGFVGAAMDAPVLADLTFDGADIMTNLYLDAKRPLAVFVFPYNGGAMPAAGFRLEQHFKSIDDSFMDGLVILSEPRLNEAEQALIAQLSEAERSGNVVRPDLDCDRDMFGRAGPGRRDNHRRDRRHTSGCCRYRCRRWSRLSSCGRHWLRRRTRQPRGLRAPAAIASRYR